MSATFTSYLNSTSARSHLAKLFQSLFIVLCFSLQSYDANAQCTNPADPTVAYLSNVCACDDGTGMITISVDIDNFPTGCASGYDIGIQYTNDAGGNSIASVMGVMSGSGIVFPTVMNIADPSDIALVSIINTCTNNGEQICLDIVNVTIATPLMLTPPTAATEAECQDQATIDAAFTAWLATASTAGGCNTMLSNDAGAAPAACGGSADVTFTATDGCGATLMETVTFTVTAPAAVMLTPPADAVETECQTQADVDAAFTAWLATVSATAGCNVMVTDNNTGAPAACGGAVTVTFTAASDCEADVTAMATFTVTAPDPVMVTPPVDETQPACQTQAALDAAYAAWLATVSTTGGCNVVVTDDPAGSADPVVACGSVSEVIFRASSDCQGDVDAMATFTVESPDPVMLTPPVDATEAECQTQADIDAAFATWLATVSSTGGCNTMITDDNTGAPLACGGSTTVTFTAASDCQGDVTEMATFTVTSPAAVVVTPPTDATEAECQTQADVDAAFTAWLATVSSTGGCNTMITDDNTGAPDACGGATIVTFTASSDCEADVTAMATFTVTMAPPVVATAPDPVTEAACQDQADIDASFDAWLDINASPTVVFSQDFTQGQSSPHCGEWRNFRSSLTGTYTSITISGSNDPVGLTLSDPALVQQITAWLRDGVGNFNDESVVDANGVKWGVGWCGFVDATRIDDPAYTIYATTGGSNGCSCTGPGSGSYLVRPCIDVYTVNPNWGGINTSSCSGPSQTMTVTFGGSGGSPGSVQGGCNIMVTNDNTGSPDACGGTTTVNWTVSSDCEPDVVVTSTFTVDPAPAVVYTPVADLIQGSCEDQATIDAAFTTWLTSFTLSGGCDPMVTNDATVAPDACGGAATVTFTMTDDCVADQVTMATFTVDPAPAVVLTPPADATQASCDDQATVDAAFTTWISTVSISGGCNAQLSNDATVAPVAAVIVTGPEALVVQYDQPGFRTTSDPLPPSLVSASYVVSDLTQAARFLISNTNTWPFGTVNAGPIDLSHYMEFTVSDSDPADILTRINYSRESYVSSGAQTASIRSSLDGFASDIDVVTVDPVPSYVPVSFDVTSIGHSVGSVTYRIYFYDAVSNFADWADLASSGRGQNGLTIFAAPASVLYEGPDACGGSTTVTWTASSDCEADVTAMATFTVTDAPDIMLTVPADQTEAACQTQADIDLAYDAFLMAASATGGCPPVTITNSGGTAGAIEYMQSMTAYTPPNLPAVETVASTVSNCDDCTEVVALPFPFDFYGVTYNQLWISSNGFVTFTDPGANGGSACCQGGPLPAASDPDNIIALFWFDLDPAEGGTITTGTNSDGDFVIHFDMVEAYNGGFTPLTDGAIVLSPDGSIRIYNESYSGGSSFGNIPYTIGIENADGTDGVLTAMNTVDSPPMPMVTSFSTGPQACGSVTEVTWTAADGCSTEMESATFTVTEPDPIVLDCDDMMIMPDMAQADADAAFTAWLNATAAAATGGCNLSVANDATMTGAVSFDFTGAVQTWTVPAGVTSIIVDTYGAQGGGAFDAAAGFNQGGLGARIQTELAVTPGQVLQIVVGGEGGNHPAGGGGGGGGSFVLEGADLVTGTLLVAAGGGGGNGAGFFGQQGYGSLGAGAVTTEDGGAAVPGGCGPGCDGAPGTAGNGGTGGQGFGGAAGAGGGGYLTAGTNSTGDVPLAEGGDALITGGMGGMVPGGVGGFGGGGAGASTSAAGGGGGGGYSGGAGGGQGGVFGAGGGGGGSFLTGSALATSAGVRSGNGLVTISFPQAPDVCAGGSVDVTFTATDDCLAPVTCTATFTVPPATIEANPMGAGSVCIDLPVGVNGRPMGGSGTYTHMWTVTAGAGTFDDDMLAQPEFTPTSAGNVTLTYVVTDAVSGCTATGIVELFVQDDCDYEFTVDDPCVCNNDADVNQDNGTFMELITVTGPNGAALPDGQDWVLTEGTGIFSASPFNEETIPGPQGIVLGAGQTLQYCDNTLGCVVYNSAGGNVLEAPFGSYYLVFAHVDAEGYCATVQGPLPDNDADPATANPANTILSICNTCFYPNVAVLNLPPTVCVSDSPINIQGVPVATGIGTWNGEATFVGGDPPYSYAVIAGLTDNGDGTATFDPAAAGPGVYTLSYTFEDQAALGGSEPGCFQAVQAEIVVAPNVTPTFTDDDDDNIVCLDQVVTLTGVPAGGVFTGAGVTDNGDGTATFMTSTAGVFAVTYSFTDGCSASYTENYTTDNIEPTIVCPADVVTSTQPASAPIVIPTGVTTTMGAGFTTTIESTFDGAGLAMYPSLSATHEPTFPNNSWVSDGVLTGEIIFDFGSVANINGFSFWNQNDGGPGGAGSTGIQGVTISSSVDGVAFTPVAGAPSTFAQVLTAGANPEVISFPLVAAQFIRFEVTSNYGDPGQTGFAEIAFSGLGTTGCDAVVTYDAPITNDNCGMTTTTQTAGFPSGGVFPVGTTTNTFVVTDLAGNTASCSFDVTVEDMEDPTVDCPADIVAVTSDGGDGDCVGQVTWDIPTASDNCSLILYNVSYTNPDGSVDGPLPAYSFSPWNAGANGSPQATRNFEIGESTVTYFVEDAAGNTAECSFTVTVTDDEAPEFTTCPPAGFTIDVFTNDCTVGLFWSIPEAGDNCGATVVQTAGPAYGSVQVPDTYTIEYVATDAAGLTDTCSFDINVIDTENPVIINCPFDAQLINVDEACMAALPDYTTQIDVEENCDQAGLVAVQVPAPGTILMAMDTVSVTVTISDLSGNSSACTFDVIAVDTIAPTIICPANVAVTNDPDLCGAVVEYDMPMFDDNCGVALGADMSQDTFGFSGAVQSFTVPAGVTEITVQAWGAEGGAGGADGTAEIYAGGLGGFVSGVLTVTPGDVIDVYVGGQGAEGSSVDAINPGGFNGGGIGGFDGLASQQVNGGGGGGASHLEVAGASLLVAGGGGGGAGGRFGFGAGGLGGNGGGLTGGTGGFIINSIGGTGGSQVAGGMAGLLTRGATNGALGLGGDGSSNVQAWGSGGGGGGYYGGAGGTSTADHGSGFSAAGGGGSSFLGAAMMTSDMAGVRMGNGQIIISYNTPGIVQTAGLPSGDLFPVGTTVNTFVVTDESGNTAECSFAVVVTDDEDPAVVCPGDLVLTTSEGGSGDCVAQAEWAIPAPTDNCGVVSYTVGVTNPNGTIEGPSLAYSFTPSNTGANGAPLANREFEVGVSTVTYFVEDAAGNTSSCSFTVTVTDDEAPEFVNCQLNSTVDVFTNDCETSVTWDIPNAVDNCKMQVAQTGGPAFGSLLAPGTYTIEYVATDDAGLTDTCTFDINVIDTENPIITCPTQSVTTVVDTDAGVCEYLVPDNSLNPDISENCDAVTMTHDHTSATSTDASTLNGHTFDLGQTVVTWTATDASGNTATCSFTMTVEDNEDPTIMCPADVASTNDAGICGAVITYDDPIVDDNCGIVLTSGISDLIVNGDFETGDLTSWSTSGLGTTGTCPNANRDWNVSDANSTGCSNVGAPMNGTFALYNMLDGDSPLSYTLEQEVVVPVGVSTADLSWIERYATSYTGDARSLTVELVDPADGSLISSVYDFDFPTSVTLTGWLPQAVDVSTDLSAYEGLPVVIRFSINVPATWTGPAGYVLDDISLVVESSASGLEQIAGLPSGSVFPVGTTTNTFIATDESGNTSTCSFDVVVTDDEAPLVMCPADAVITTSTGGLLADCEGQLDWLHPLPSDNCGVSLYSFSTQNPDGTIDGPFDLLAVEGSYTSNEASSNFQIGVSTVTYIVVDAAGNSSSCSFTVTVTDDEAPEFVNCQMNSTQDVFTNDCETSVTWDIPNATDNCSVTVAQTAGPAFGSIVAPGTYTVEYTATDGAGLTDVCSFDINVIDTENPVLTCPDQSAITVRGTNDGCTFVMGSAAFDATFSENCAPLTSLVHDHTSATSASDNTLNGHTFDLGNTTITWTATDASGNTATCSFVVTVQDDDAPMFDCPAALNVQGCAGTVPDLVTALTGTDNCTDAADIVFTQSPEAGTQAGPNPGDVVVVTITATDEAGNETSCTVDVTVIDSEMPVFVSCPTQTIIFATSTDECSAFVEWSVPVALDNCGDPLVAILTSGPAPGSTQAVGMYTVVYTATDPDGNAATCEFDVEVVDTQAPTLAAGIPVDMTLSCEEADGFVPFVMTSDMLTDNCTDPVTDIENNFVGGQGSDPAMCEFYTYTDLYEWIATDDAGNSMRWSQRVSFQDTTAPVLTLPLNTTVECGDSTDPADTGMATAVDNCAAAANITIEFTDVMTDGCGLSGVITRTWTATDPCGNVSTGDQIVTVEDNTAPDLVCMDIEVELDANGNATISHLDVITSVSDACSDPDSLTFAMDRTMFTCDDLGEVVVRLVVTDPCGNMADCTPTITVVDNLAPTITCPLDQTINLDPGACDYYVPGGAAAMDNCGATVTYSPDITADPLPPGETIITATATDASGNTAECMFTYTIIEFDPPTDDLTCNNAVNLSLGSDCSAVIFADMILEGSNYGCYDDYCITIVDASGNAHSNMFDLSDAGQTFEVSITDCLGGGNTCWGFVTIEEKLVPEIECPADIEISCNVDPDSRDAAGNLVTGELIVTTCEPTFSTWYEDVFVDNGACTDPRGVITRTFYLEDESGNVVSCVQTITITGFDLDDVVFPDDFDINNPFSCEAVAAEPRLIDPDGIPGIDDDGTGFPTVNGVPVQLAGNLCGASVNVTDEIYDICEGSYEILRTWKVRDMCGPVTADNPRTHVQVIKVLDTEGPKLGECIDDITISTQPWGCDGQVVLPNPTKLEDVCTHGGAFHAEVLGRGQITVTGSFEAGDLEILLTNVTKGSRSKVRYIASDPCGNETVCEFYVDVIDQVAPVVSTVQDIVISLSQGGNPGESSAKVFVEQVDNESFDECGPVYAEIRRTSGGDCTNVGANGHNNNLTFSNAAPRGYVSEPDVYDNDDTDDGQFVKVCCEDVNSATVDIDGDGVLDAGYVEVVLRVWDDANMSGVFGDSINGQVDNYNEAWSYVKVEDNTPAAIQCPADATIECFWQIDLSTDFGRGFVSVDSADFSKTGIATTYSTCGAETITFQDRPRLDDCGIGTITRTFSVSKLDKSGNAITTTCQQLITVSDYQSTFVVTPPNGSPYDYDECSFDVDAIPANQKPTVTGGICDVIGESVKVDTFLFEGGVCKKWVVEYNYMNWCTGESIGPIAVEYIFNDEEAPVVECQDTCYSVDADCSYFLSLTKSATDAGGCVDNGWLKWLVTVDTWADGTVDYVGSSFVSNTRWATNETLSAQYGYAPTTQWIAIPATSSGQDFAAITLPEDLGGQMSNHKVTYKVTDGCHNFSSCEELIMVADKKAPTPYCVSLASALMQDPDGPAGPAVPMVELWACDFNVGSFDNCSAQEELMYTFNEVPFVVNEFITHRGVTRIVNSSVPHYFDENGQFVDWDGDDIVLPAPTAGTVARYNSGDLQKWVPETLCSGMVFNEASTGYPQVNIRMSVWDKKLNQDYCDVLLSLQLNTTAGGTRMVAGRIATESGQGVEAVEVTVDALGIESESMTTALDGNFGIEIEDADAVVSAKRDGDDDNGISTLDLVLIQRHILGLAEFTSPYNTFAADVNNSGTVTGADVVELRQLILGITAEFASTDSWRFLDATQAADNGNVHDISEHVYSVLGSTVDADLVAIKMGDVNGSAETIEIRSGKSMSLFYEDEAVSSGEVLEVALTTADYIDGYGYQFTIDLEGLELVDATAGALESGTFDYATFGDQVTVSYASSAAESVDEVIRLVLKAKADGDIADMINVSSSITTAEAYIGHSLLVSSVELRSNSDVDYALLQNEPNPFNATTEIGFVMGEAGEGTLTVYDVTGKVLKSITNDYPAGPNSIVLRRSDFGVTGMMYYTFESGDFIATKKMILVE